jgi:large subunit ribosomal protein L25
MKSITIKGQLRSETGKKSSRRLRSEGQVPAVIYGGNETIHFYATPLEFRDIVYTAEFMLANIEVDGKSYKCILKDLQFHKLTDKVTHLDFLELVEGKKLIANIPLKFVGTAEGVKNGGRFVPKMNAISVRTVPAKLVEHVEVDISELLIGKNLRISDVVFEGAEIMHSPRIPVCAVATTRVLKQEANAAGGEDEEEGAEGGEGEEAKAEAPAEG